MEIQLNDLLLMIGEQVVKIRMLEAELELAKAVDKETATSA
jgi:hypothetical protein